MKARPHHTKLAEADLQNVFTKQLAEYKQLIDDDIAAYAVHVRQSTHAQYGGEAGAVVDTFLGLLQRGGKRIRGALVMVGYEMCAGTDKQMIVRAATALEMLHAYMLIIDDIQDRSQLRRGEPTAHTALAIRHTDLGWRGDAAHTGVSLALNAALAGAHAAQMLLAGLSTDPELRIKVLGIVNHTMVVTAHGQTYDIYAEVANEPPTHEQLEHILEWKTANYTFLNPLCVGMVLAGAGCEQTDAIRDFALHAGKAFQITDDILGVFSDAGQSGKDHLGDIREGKQTLLTVHALQYANPKDAAFLRASLGDGALSTTALQRCQEIIRSSGALDKAQTAARQHVAAAVTSLEATAHLWNKPSVQFLRGLAQALLGRIT